MFEEQFNSAYHEIQVEYVVKINTVMLKKVTEEKIDKWFDDKMALLQSGLQLNHGNSMHNITVKKCSKRYTK